MIRPDSPSYPYLAIAQTRGHDYGLVLAVVDWYEWLDHGGPEPRGWTHRFDEACRASRRDPSVERRRIREAVAREHARRSHLAGPAAVSDSLAQKRTLTTYPQWRPCPDCPDPADCASWASCCGGAKLR